jgi:trigger factor
MHGPRLEQQALESAIQEGVQRLMSENKLRPGDAAAVELEEHQPGHDAVVKVELETLPDVPEANIADLRIERLAVEPSDAEVDEALSRIAEGQKSYEPAPANRAARWRPVNRLSRAGRRTPFEGGKGEAMPSIGSAAHPGFEDQLSAPRQRAAHLNVRFPDDYNVAPEGPRDATFESPGTRSRRRARRKRDDASPVMGSKAHGQLARAIKGSAPAEERPHPHPYEAASLLDELADRRRLPGAALRWTIAEFAQIWQQLEHEASHEADPEAARAEMEKERDDYRRIAERRVRLGLLLSDLGQKNGIEISAQEMNTLLAQAAQQYRPEDRQRFAQYVQENPMAAAQLRAPLYEDKVVDFLFGKADIAERPATREALQHAIEAEEGHVHGPGCGHDHADEAKPAKAKKPAAKKAKGDDAAPAAEEAAPAKKGKAKKVDDAPAEKPKKSRAKKSD